ncbi:MAG: rRNA biogenesis protein [Candidatus Methanoperedens sp.]|nr:rRNA biogenesis protein [Candidatus Methanoperedens sp.]
MQIRTWFGIFTLDEDRISGVELFQKDLNAITSRLADEPLLLRGKARGVDIRDLAIEYGFVPSHEEYDSLLHEINIRLVKKQMVLSVTQDRQIIAAVEAIDDINSTANILAERLREWYLLFNGTDLQGSELARHIIGSNEPDLREMRNLASAIVDLYETRSSIEGYLKDSMLRAAPNLSCIAGPTLGARLLSIAGSLEKLASMPSSTVQVIGANNALFKHLKGKAPSPKHGLIFRHPLINTAPKRLRGKIARAVASKISLAARCDFYSGELKENLAREMEAKVSDIKKQHSRKKA